MGLVDTVHHMWHTGEIPQELIWTLLVLIPKGTTTTRGIGLLEETCATTCLINLRSGHGYYNAQPIDTPNTSDVGEHSRSDSLTLRNLAELTQTSIPSRL